VILLWRVLRFSILRLCLIMVVMVSVWCVLRLVVWLSRLLVLLLFILMMI